MSENHDHPHPQRVRFTLWLRGWLGIPYRRVLFGTNSSQQGGELLIFFEGGFHSYPFTRVWRLTAIAIEPVEHSHT